MSLTTYWKKRDFSKTPEPAGEKQDIKKKQLTFVVQKHHASHLHYDFRLEMEGVLKSWAVPKGPSLNPEDRRLAMMVEDHPYSYRSFEGIIPKGNYGAGKVIVWDEGIYEPIAVDNRTAEEILLEALANGHISFTLFGKKLHGEFSLIKQHKDDNSWLLIKKNDAYATTEDVTKQIQSVQSGKDVEELTGGNEAENIAAKHMAVKTTIPTEIKPMLASLSDKPFDDPQWIFEVKWDGYRAIAQIQNDTVRLYSRNNQEYNADYPELVTALRKISHDVVLDGEIVVVDTEGRSAFQSLQNYKGTKTGTLLYYVFDVLYLDGYDLRQQPLIDRKSLIPDLIRDVPYVRYSEHIAQTGVPFFAAVKKKNLEGIIAKKKDSWYVSKRSAEWLKIKNIQEQEAIICGFTAPQGTRKEFGALLLGMYTDNILTYVGHTGSGFDTEKLTSLRSLLDPLIVANSPFADPPKPNAPVTWVKQEVVCQVKFSEMTDAGVMRQAIFLGLRKDKPAQEVHPEELVKNQQKVTITNGEKVYWPDDGYTKKDMVLYYKTIAPYILPYLTNRLQSLHRFPSGITGQSFFQKDMMQVPVDITTVPITRDDGKVTHYLLCENEKTLLYMANLGCIEMNPWNSRYPNLDKPDYLILDLDPNDISFQETVTVAVEIKKMLEKIGIEAFVKTSGKRGLHILLPLGAKYSAEQAKQFAEILANSIYTKLPNITSIVRDPKKRQKKVYIDFLQNNSAQTLAAPYSLRPVKGAQVSTPLAWSELTPSLSPSDFTIQTIIQRLKKGDVWKGFLEHPGIDILQSLDALHTIK